MQAFDIQHEVGDFNEIGDNLTDVFSILEANDEQFRCIWTKIENQTQMLKTIQSQIAIKESELETHTSELRAYHEMLFDIKDFITSELEDIDNRTEREFADVNRHIICGAQVNTIMMITTIILLISVMIQHYEITNLSEYQIYRHFTHNSSEL